MPNNDQTISPNNRNPHRAQTIFLRHPDACIEQLYPTSGIVPTAKRTNNWTAARLSHRSALDDGNSVISRIHARQTAKLTGEWGIGTPTHIQQPQPNGHCLSHKPQAVSLIQFDTNPNKNPRIAAQRPDTRTNVQTSGHVKRGNTPIYPDNSRNAFTPAGV